tara:strand:- start:83 stop:313 length:231 start_codon:yes stop_codon:yes gene_type:complete
MIDKGLETEIVFKETPNLKMSDNKSLKLEENHIKKVDINVLKARAADIQQKESRKNISIFIFTLITFCLIGLYLSI